MKRCAAWIPLALLMVAVSHAQAAEIAVDGTDCTLAEAITSANNDNAAGNGCVNGSGDDTIILQANVTLAAPLPEISSTVIIEGGGHFISGNGDAAVGTVLKVASSGNLTVNGASVKDGRSDIGSPAGSLGGGIYNHGGTVTVTNSTLDGNGSVWNAGGGIYNDNGGTVVLNSSTVSNNSARGCGGGIYNDTGTISITNSTVSGNITRDCGGGGIYNLNGGTVILNSSTVSGNTSHQYSSGRGAGICNSSGTVTLHSSIVSGNRWDYYLPGEGVELYGNFTTSRSVLGHSGKASAEAFFGFSPSASDVNATSDGSTPTALSAILSPLADNGGSTQTHALPAGSPAIDLDTECSLGTDQRGVRRPFGAGCDVGAFEYRAVALDMTPIHKLLLLKR